MTALRSDDIVVTGLGATSPLGGDVASTWEAMLAGRSGVHALTEPWADDIVVQIGARMAVDPRRSSPASRPGGTTGPNRPRWWPRSEAWNDAGFKGLSEDNGLVPERVAVVIGTGVGGVTSLIGQHDTMIAKGARGVSPLLIPMEMPNGPAAYVGLAVGARAGVHTPVSACASGAEAIAYGLDLLALRPRRRRASWAGPRRASTR